MTSLSVCVAREGPACVPAHDWAARLFAADAAVVSCFVVVIFISGQNRPVSLSLSLDLHFDPSLLPPAAKFPSFSSSHLRLPLATPSLHQMANTGGRVDTPNSLSHLLL